MGRHLTIRAVLAIFVTSAILLTAAGVGVPAYVNSKASADQMWGQLAAQISDTAAEQTLRYLESGHSQLRLMRNLTEQGRLNPDDVEATLRYLLEALRAQSHVTWCSYAGIDGRYLTAYRLPDDPRLRLSWRFQNEEGTVYRDQVEEADGTLTPIPQKLGHYDPRERPWWPTSKQADEPTWADPFLFASRQQPGVFLTLRQDDQGGQMMGAWNMEYELSQLARFLAEAVSSFESQGLTGAQIYLITDKQTVVGHPRAADESTVGWTTQKNPEGGLQLADVKGHADPLLRLGYQQASNGSERFRFVVDGRPYLGVSQHFPEIQGGLPWTVMVVAPESSIMGVVERNTRNAVITAILVALLACALGFWAATLLTRQLQVIASDLDQMGRLEFGSGSKVVGSLVDEVVTMIEVRDRMRGGLRSFAKYVPAEVVRELMQQGREAELGGSVQELTVYFSDVAGFTAIAEELSPGALFNLLGEYLEAMSQAIREEHKGTLDKFIGDGIMAFWGAPRKSENHALEACQAALTCATKLQELRRRFEVEGQPAFHARIGINTGDTLVGNIGAADRMNYTVMGDTVNVASRLERLSKHFGTEIIIGERTRQLAGKEVVARPLDKVAVEGKESGIVVYELLSRRQDATPDLLQFEEDCEEAFKRYLSREFSEAAELLGELQKQRPEDVSIEYLLKRSLEYAKTPPDENWNAVRSINK